MAIGHRMSLLPVVQRCGLAGRLSKGRGAGRAAAMSTAFHAKCAAQDPDEVKRLWSLLSDAEQAEVAEWQKPSDVTVGRATLRYDDSEREVALGIDEMGFYTADESRALTWGHMDFGWVVDGVAYVEDIKKTAWTSSDGPDSLQLHAYARAFAMKHGCYRYVTGLWIATDGVHKWSTDFVDLDGPRADVLWERIYHAAMNNGEASLGDHCDRCYQRLRCPEYCMPAALADTVLAPVAEGIVPTSETAAAMLQFCQRAEKVIAAAKENLAMWVKQDGLVISDGKKEWRAVEQPGRKSLDHKALEEKLGSLDPFMKTGADFVQMRWTKVRT